MRKERLERFVTELEDVKVIAIKDNKLVKIFIELVNDDSEGFYYWCSSTFHEGKFDFEQSVLYELEADKEKFLRFADYSLDEITMNYELLQNLVPASVLQ